MFPSKLRCVARFAQVAVLAGCASIACQSMNAQEPARPDGKEAKIRALLEERLAATQQAEKLLRQRVKSATGIVGELLEATRQSHETALELCKTDKERHSVMEMFLAAARENERIATAYAAAKQSQESDALLAKAERLRVEIALERAKARKDAPQKGAAIPVLPPATLPAVTLPFDPAATTKVVVAAKDQPKDGKLEITQPGTIHAFETIHLYSRVPGFLKTLHVDIGDRVKRDQVLAVLDVPELEAQVRHDQAALERARARIQEAKAGLAVADAESQLAKAEITHAEAAAKHAATWTHYRELYYKRLKELNEKGAIDAGVTDEAKKQYDAAVEAEAVAVAAVATAKLKLQLSVSKTAQAQANVLATEADLECAKATLDRSRAQLSFATIKAPFDGVVSERRCNPRDFIRSANDDKREPLLTVMRVDKMRVVVHVPERDAPLIRVGNAAEIQTEFVAGKKWAAKVSRFAPVLNPKERTMEVELDLPDPDRRLYPGMSCTVTIKAEKQ